MWSLFAIVCIHIASAPLKMWIWKRFISVILFKKWNLCHANIRPTQADTCQALLKSTSQYANVLTSTCTLPVVLFGTDTEPSDISFIYLFGNRLRFLVMAECLLHSTDSWILAVPLKMSNWDCAAREKLQIIRVHPSPNLDLLGNQLKSWMLLYYWSLIFWQKMFWFMFRRKKIIGFW